MRRFKTKLLSLVLVIVMMFSISTVGSVANYVLDEETGGSIYDDTYVSGSLVINNAFMGQSSADEYIDLDVENNSVEISIGANKESVELTFDYNDVNYTAVLYGTYNEISTESGIGYVGVYYGYASPASDTDSTLNDVSNIPLVADITFDNTDIFAVLSLGYVSGTSNPDILFYGDFSDKIRDIASINSTQYMERMQTEPIYENNLVPLPRTDGTPKLQGVDPAVYVYDDSVTGILSVYHSDQLINQGNMSVYAKVNTNCEAIKNIMQESNENGTVTYACADRFNISIIGRNQLHILTNSYVPQNAQTSVNIIVPYFTEITGFGTIDIPIVTSTTSVTTSRNPSSSQYPDNMITWELYKLGGWDPDDYDGIHSSPKGMGVCSTYTLEGNVTNPMNALIEVEAVISYAYSLITSAVVGGTTLTLHTQSEPLSTSTLVEILS